MLRLALLALALTTCASAQTDRRSLVVDGAADLSVPPDQVVVAFSVQTEGRDAPAVFRQHEEEVGRVLTAVRRLGIPDRDIEITTVSFSGVGRNASASRGIRVTTDSLRIVPDLIAVIVEAGASQIGGVTYGLKDPDAHADRALDRAVERAHAKAERMARATGARLGPVRAVRESGVVPPMPMYGNSESYGEVVVSQRSRGVGASYSAADQTVSARVVVEYDLVSE